MHVHDLSDIFSLPLRRRSSLGNKILALSPSSREILPPLMALEPLSMASSIRPNHKEHQWTDAYDALFDQYMHSDRFGLSADTGDSRGLDEFSSFFDLPASSGGSELEGGLSHLSSWDTRQEEAKSWPERFSSLEQKAESPVHSRAHYANPPKFRAKDFVSNTELFNLEGLCPVQIQRIPLTSPPLSPVQAPAGRTQLHSSTTLPVGISRPKSAGIQKPTGRKISTSPGMMRPSQYRGTYHDVWAQRVEATANKFNLRIPGQPMPSSPPPSVKVAQWDDHELFSATDWQAPTGPSQVRALEEQVSPHSRNSHLRSASYGTPLSSPPLQDSTYMPYQVASPAINYINSPFLADSFEALATPPPAHTVNNTPWDADGFDSFDFGFSEHTDHHDVRPTNYCPPPNIAQPSPSPYYTTYQTRTTMALTDGIFPSVDLGLANSGLMIQADPYLVGGFSDMALHSPLCAAPNYSKILTPQKLRHHRSTPSLAHQHRSPTHQPPPLPTSPTRSRRAPSKGNTHRRSKSSTHGARGSSSSAGFVNYTPDDSKKILTGVAPSGSSKTKARREKEAADKRRRLSQAAARAVIEAGGDIEALEREGLFV